MGRQHCCLPNFILKGKTMITKEELIAQIDFSVDHDQVRQIVIQKHKSAVSTSNKKIINVYEYSYDENDFPCNTATVAYSLMRFDIIKTFLRCLKDYKEKPNLAEILYETCQAVIINKSKFRPPGYDMSVDFLLTDIISEELINEISNDYDDIFEINKL
jgi:hypothetical protein